MLFSQASLKSHFQVAAPTQELFSGSPPAVRMWQNTGSTTVSRCWRRLICCGYLGTPEMGCAMVKRMFKKKKGLEQVQMIIYLIFHTYFQHIITANGSPNYPSFKYSECQCFLESGTSKREAGQNNIFHVANALET